MCNWVAAGGPTHLPELRNGLLPPSQLNDKFCKSFLGYPQIILQLYISRIPLDHGSQPPAGKEHTAEHRSRQSNKSDCVSSVVGESRESQRRQGGSLEGRRRKNLRLLKVSTLARMHRFPQRTNPTDNLISIPVVIFDTSAKYCSSFRFSIAAILRLDKMRDGASHGCRYVQT